VPPAASTTALKRALLRDLLRRVSRLFYTTLVVVPASVRDQVCLAYLFARAADTIADTDVLARAQRLAALKEFKAQFAGEKALPESIERIKAALAPCQADSAERELLERLGDCFVLFEAFAPDDRSRVRRLMATLINGMEMDLTVFPGETVKDLAGLASLDDLDRYTYYVAGCVGEFWTDLMCAHVPALRGWNVADMSRIGVRFGKGLQMTNILKDLSKDLRRGRCYVPEPLLKEQGLTPADLLRAESLPRLRPLLARLAALAVEHLDQGMLYTMAIPRRAVRLRLACLWPILSAGETLKLALNSPDLLNPAVTVKITHAQVRRIVAVTTMTAGCGYVAAACWGRVRKQIA
jgi:farnesyl-diphosphate farnesyltransferase